MKTCQACKIAKPLDEFHKASKSPDGRQYRCKPCAISAARQRALDNPEAKREADRKYRQTDKYKANRKARREGPQRERILGQKREGWYRNHEANLEKLRARQADPEFREKQRARYARWRKNNPRGHRKWWLQYFYGVTLEQWDEMVLAQEGRCAVCSLPAELVVDHCHTAQRVRELLCGLCNSGLGLFKDDPERLRAAAEYIEKHHRS
ncbi:endonuclease VII domain-containing protein [Streptomyces prunicolor]|uniref:endonuclease VII domain-containing protein n=1 Tax=Streptomyces prunicolor TaxID=67348 RepID=UPI00037BDCEE|nr:endonuclease VII domain-containing protein [Streptomyces prunicolor]